MKKCKTCKHWDPALKFTIGYGLGVGRCKNVPMYWDATEWDDDGEGRRFKDEYKDTKAFTQDASDYRADLLTKPDFGCVSHEPISPPASKR